MVDLLIYGRSIKPFSQESNALRHSSKNNDLKDYLYTACYWQQI
jgi:DNA polymerase III psi subunit